MTEGLPKGLFSMNEDVSVEIAREDRVAIEDITKLWRGSFVVLHTAHATKADVLFRH